MVVDAQGRAWNDIPDFNRNWIDSNAGLDLPGRGMPVTTGSLSRTSPTISGAWLCCASRYRRCFETRDCLITLTGETLYSDTPPPRSGATLLHPLKTNPCNALLNYLVPAFQQPERKPMTDATLQSCRRTGNGCWLSSVGLSPRVPGPAAWSQDYGPQRRRPGGTCDLMMASAGMAMVLSDRGQDRMDDPRNFLVKLYGSE